MVSQEKLKELLHYDPVTGEFTWLKPSSSRMKVGSRAGSVAGQGYRDIEVCCKRYKAHRLAWFYMTGAWPRGVVDHINGAKDDNSFANLREATKSENQKNRKVNVNNKSGFRGVFWNSQKQKWVAKVQIDGKQKHLGFFDAPEAASGMYETFTRVAFGEFYKEVMQ